MFTLWMQAGVKRSQLCMQHPKQEPHVPVPVLSFSLSYTNFPLSAPSSRYRLSPAPHPGKNRGSSEIQKHMWLAIKLHMHSVYPNPPPTPHSQSPPTTQTVDTHIDQQGGEKSYRRGDAKTIGQGGSNIRQQSELSVAGSKKQ